MKPVPDHDIVKFHLDCQLSTTPKSTRVSYRPYHKTDIHKFQAEVFDILFISYIAKFAIELYDKNI